MEAVLARVAREFTDNERSRHGPVPDGSGEPQDFFPLCSDQFQIELAPNKRSECWVIALLPRT